MQSKRASHPVFWRLSSVSALSVIGAAVWLDGIRTLADLERISAEAFRPAALVLLELQLLICSVEAREPASELLSVTVPVYLAAPPGR
jgi:hypothetical protein